MGERRTFQGPKGTRDFYPADLLQRRYIEKLWRDTSIRHGFEEIEGPTIETAELYAVKSGGGILGEMFGVFSGKDQADLAALRETGRAPLALRPEFTPTLARMYAARAAQLPRPTKWFTAGPYFRAERPQRGRLREFCQWNCDVIGGDDRVSADAGVVACAVGCFGGLGLTPGHIRVHCNDRDVLSKLVADLGVPEERLPVAFDILDDAGKVDARTLADRARRELGDVPFLGLLDKPLAPVDLHGRAGLPGFEDYFDRFGALRSETNRAGLAGWCMINMRIARGLAYYTGMVFEVIAEGERAIAGGGRYDNLIELFGGPPTPAVGFGMGDVVLGNLLRDRGLMPEGPALLGALSVAPASLRPDAFVIANEQEDSQRLLRPIVALLRQGAESEPWLSRDDRKPWDADRYRGPVPSIAATQGLPRPSAAFPPLHARHSFKATRNIGKLLQEAAAVHAMYAVIIENGERCTVRDLAARDERKDVPLADVGPLVAGRGGGGPMGRG